MTSCSDSTEAGTPVPPRVVDWARMARRLRTSAVVLAALAVGAWLVTGLLDGRLVPSDLAGWLGLALGGLFVAEIVIVGGTAVRGMLRAGARGDRLASGDVSVLPPQLRRRR